MATTTAPSSMGSGRRSRSRASHKVAARMRRHEQRSRTSTAPRAKLDRRTMRPPPRWADQPSARFAAVGSGAGV